MTFLPSPPEHARQVEVFRAYPDAAGPLLDYHEVVLRGPSPLAAAMQATLAARALARRHA